MAHLQQTMADTFAADHAFAAASIT